MKHDRQISVYDRIKGIVSLKRAKVTLYMAAILWVAFAAQVMVNHMFQEKLQITEAFIKSETQEMQSTLEIIAEYKSYQLSETEIKNVISRIADSIHLDIEEGITVWNEAGRSEHFILKQAKQANTKIKFVTLKHGEEDIAGLKNYIIIQLSILKGIESIDQYKNILEDTLDAIGAENKQITLQYEGSREGCLTEDQKHELATLLVDELQGRIALEYDEGDLYTVYAYTGMLKEYVTAMENKINVQIAITYNELTNKTTIKLATPILNNNW